MAADRSKKPFKDCKECLYILNTCVLCNNADMFFDREDIIHNTISEMTINKGRPLVKVVQSTINNRVATQRRDSNFY